MSLGHWQLIGKVLAVNDTKMVWVGTGEFNSWLAGAGVWGSDACWGSNPRTDACWASPLSTTELHYPGPAPFMYTFVVILYYAFETVSFCRPGSPKRYYVAPKRFMEILLLQPPKYEVYRHEPPTWPHLPILKRIKQNKQTKNQSWAKALVGFVHRRLNLSHSVTRKVVSCV